MTEGSNESHLRAQVQTPRTSDALHADTQWETMAPGHRARYLDMYYHARWLERELAAATQEIVLRRLIDASPPPAETKAAPQENSLPLATTDPLVASRGDVQHSYGEGADPQAADGSHARQRGDATGTVTPAVAAPAPVAEGRTPRTDALGKEAHGRSIEFALAGFKALCYALERELHAAQSAPASGREVARDTASSEAKKYGEAASAPACQPVDVASVKTAQSILADSINCPDCGAHDYGLYAAGLVGCPHCAIAKAKRWENLWANEHECSRLLRDERDAARKELTAALDQVKEAVREACANDWQPMLTAPLDGSEIEIMVRHQTYWTAFKVNGMAEAKSQWQGIVRGHWIDHHGGGWTWRGLAGSPVAWRALDLRAVGAESTR